MGTKGWGAISRRWGRWWRWLGMALAGWGLTLQGWSAIAQAPQPSAPASDTGVAIAQPLAIGVSPRPPFVIQSSSAQPGSDWDGIGVDLWRKVAYELNLDYQWREVEPSQAIAQLQSGTLDVALMTATAPPQPAGRFQPELFRHYLRHRHPKTTAILGSHEISALPAVFAHLSMAIVAVSQRWLDLLVI